MYNSKVLVFAYLISKFEFLITIKNIQERKKKSFRYYDFKNYVIRSFNTIYDIQNISSNTSSYNYIFLFEINTIKLCKVTNIKEEATKKEEIKNLIKETKTKKFKKRGNWKLNERIATWPNETLIGHWMLLRFNLGLRDFANQPLFVSKPSSLKISRPFQSRTTASFVRSSVHWLNVFWTTNCRQEARYRYCFLTASHIFLLLILERNW